VDCISLTVMHLIGRHQADASVVMLLIVPVEEAAAERLGILDTAEALWELGLVFHGFEVAFRERIVVGRMRPAVGFGDAEIGEQERRGLGSHGTATVGMQGQLAGRHGMLGDGIVEQCREQGRAFSVGNAPEAYPVDSGLSRCSMLSDRIGAVARADTDGEGAVARGIPEVVSR